MILLKQKVLTKWISVVSSHLPCDYVLDVTGKDSDKEHEEEKTIPDCDEEGNYTTFVYSVVSLVRSYITSKVLWCDAICLP